LKEYCSPIDGKPLERYERLGDGHVILSEDPPGEWLLTWLPRDRIDVNYPGFTLSIVEGRLPRLDDADAYIEWAAQQSWTTLRDRGAPS